MRAAAVVVIALFIGCASEYPAPPETDRGDVLDTIHGIDFPDPYRWLEEQDSDETRAWIESQNAYAERIIGETPVRARLRSRFRELLDVDEIGAPRRGGEYEYFTMRRVGEELPIIYRRPAPPEGELVAIDPAEDYELVLDPHGMSEEKTTRVDILSVSADDALVLYSVRDGGKDEIVVRLRDVDQKADLPERLPEGLYGDVFFSEKGDGFYYVARSRETGPRVKFHQLGSAISEDVLIFGEGFGPRSFIRVDEVDEGRLLVLTVQHGWARSELHLKEGRDGSVRAIATDVDARFYPLFVEGRLLVRTNLDAPNNRVLAIDRTNPALESWQEILPEGEVVMTDFTSIDEKLYVTYLRDVSSEIRIFELDGSPAGEIDVPEHHTATIRGAGPGKAFLSLESFLRPEQTHLLDLETGARELWREDDIPFEQAGFAVEQVRYPSRDGTDVPMYLVHADGLEPAGDTPTLLFGYGGFNVALTPSFDPMAAVWIEQGGVFAMANLRGGSEYGERWHRSGMLENKQNVFDDFIAAGDWLVESGYTSPERLAIRGVSNGGLLVASALTQRPDLYRAVLCGFPDLDMVRFYTFTETNNMPALLEYGDAEIPEQFEFLRKFSPYQAVEAGTRYPAVMLTSGDLDTRVSPLQARRMTARLQWASTSAFPVILRYHPKAGHAASNGLPMSQRIEDRAAELAFLLSQLGVDASAE